MDANGNLVPKTMDDYLAGVENPLIPVRLKDLRGWNLAGICKQTRIEALENEIKLCYKQHPKIITEFVAHKEIQNAP